VPPVVIGMAWPDYPTEARGHPRKVVVILAVHVTAAGEVDSVRVEENSGCSACEREAVAAAWSIRCQPGSRGGKPVAAWMRLPMTFGKR
jgi:protein TonB